MGKKGIQKDLALGTAGEQIVISLLNEVGIVSKVQGTKGKFSDYDVESSYDGRNFTSEVKYDLYAISSKNIAVEVFNPKSGRPSGLMASKSDLWMVVTDEVHVCNTQALKKWVNDHPAKRIVSTAGDGNATILLYPISIIFGGDLFVRIDNLSGDDRRKVVIAQLASD